MRHATLQGPDAAPVVVLLHPIATDRSVWQPQHLAWLRHFRLLSIDLPGHGSRPPMSGTPDFARYSDAVLQTMHEHDVTCASVVGLSFGAMVAQRMAADHPACIDRLVLANCTAHTPVAGTSLWQERITVARQEGMGGVVEPTLARWFTPEFARRSPLSIDAVRAIVLAGDVDGFCDAAAIIATLEHRSLLSMIQASTLVVAGANDVAAPPTATAQIADAIPDCQLVQLDAPHLSNVEDADRFTEIVGAFLLGDRRA